MWRGMAGVVVAMIVAAGGETVSAQNGSPAVRAESDGVRELIAGGMQRSETFRDLGARLDTSDVVVYVRFSSCSRGVPACMLWASAGAGSRRLLIKVDRFGRNADELMALLAHELQHANEVATAPEITDAISFQESFASRGWKHLAGFETGEATRITKQVAAELSRR